MIRLLGFRVPGRLVRTVRRPASLILASAILAAPVAGQASAENSKDPEDPYEMQELVVTASGFEQQRINAPASITVVSGAKAREQRSASLAEMLADVEGIDIGSRVGKTGGLEIGLRGMPSEYTLVLIDGRRQNTAGSVTPNGFGETSTSFMPPVSAIERIEIIRGPMATLYGSDAMGGVINIITKKGVNRWRGTLTTDATLQQRTGFGHTFSGNGTLDGPLISGLLNASVRGSLHHRQASELSPTGEFDENTEISRRGPSPTQAEIATAGGRLTLTPASSHEVWLDFDGSWQTYDNSEAQLGTLDDPEQGRFSGYGPEQKFNRVQATLAHTWNLVRGQLTSSLMRNTTETIGRTIPPGTPGGPPGSGAPDKEPGSPRELEATNTVFDAKLVTVLNAHTLTIGGQYWDAHMIDGVALGPFSFNQWSLFAENEWRFVPSVGLTVGVRRDDHSTFGGHLSPRAYVVWNARPEWTVKGGVSRGFRTPRVEQLVDGIIGFTGQGTIAVIGTPTLRPETSTTVEAGIHYTADSGMSAGATVFNNAFTDKITRGTPIPNCTFALAPNRPGCVDYGDFPTQESFARSVNVDEAVTRGFELSASFPLIASGSLTLNYTFTESEQKSGENAGFPLTNTPKHMLNGNVRGQITERSSAWFRGEYRSSRARRTTAEYDPAYEALGDFRAYSLFHLGGAYRVNDRVTVNATIYNVLNTDFLRYAAYPVEPTEENPSGTAYTNVYNNHQEGRRLWLSTTIEF